MALFGCMIGCWMSEKKKGITIRGRPELIAQVLRD
jgi:hypothetical protein